MNIIKIAKLRLFKLKEKIEKKPVKEKPNHITYLLQHFKLDTEAFIRKQSISTKDIIITTNEYHQEYDHRLTQKQTEDLIQAWNDLMAEGFDKIRKGEELTGGDIERIFSGVEVGKGEKKGEVYLKYKWDTEDMARELRDFIRAKNDNYREFDTYIRGKWGNLFRRWRETDSNNRITIEEQIEKVYDRIRFKYLWKEMKDKLNI